MTERELLAAELALRLLSDDEHAAAVQQLAIDPELAALVAEWEARLAPMADELAEVEPSPELWSKLASSLRGAQNDNDGDLTAILKTRLRRWQWGSLAAAAASLVLGFLGAPLLRGPGPETVDPAAAAVLVASLPVGGAEGPRLGLTYLPRNGDLVIEAGGVPGDGVHDHELWLVVPGAKPVSMGVVATGRQSRVHLSRELGKKIGSGLGVVLTREPLGGAPAGADAGPVVAEGKFSVI
jgi:anti-sigma-K factor RskA